MTATINTNTVSQKMADALPILLHMVDPEEFARYDCMTPTALDYQSDYRDGVHKMEYQIDAGATGRTTVDRPMLNFPRPADTNPPGRMRAMT